MNTSLKLVSEKTEGQIIQNFFGQYFTSKMLHFVRLSCQPYPQTLGLGESVRKSQTH